LTDLAKQRVEGFGGPSDRVVRAVAILAGIASALLAISHLCDLALFDFHVGLVNADSDWSVWGWAGVVADFAPVVGAVQLALTTHRQRSSLIVLVVLTAFLSADDFLQLHERVSELGSRLALPHASRVVWPLIFMPIMVAMAIILWRLSAQAPMRARMAIRGGLAALVFAILLEMASPGLFAIGYGHGTWPYELEVAVEEALELGGWMLIAGGLAALALHSAVTATRETLRAPISEEP
jgi:hypothetical protein